MKEGMIPRALGEKIVSAAGMFPIVSLTGPRQSGKTTLALLCALLDIQSPEQLDSHYLRGNIFESFIIAEHVKSRLHAGRRPNAFFWRNSTGHEIDLIIEAGTQLLAVEIKSGETLNNEFLKGLKYFKRLSSVPDENFYLVYGGDRNHSRKHGQVIGWTSISKLP